jgi:hypothetical protein
MAQDFVGSNNINLLQPNGQFGTRHQVRLSSTMKNLRLKLMRRDPLTIGYFDNNILNKFKKKFKNRK